MRIQDLCRGGAAEILLTSHSRVAAAAKIWASKWGVRGGGLGPQGNTYLCIHMRLHVTYPCYMHPNLFRPSNLRRRSTSRNHIAQSRCLNLNLLQHAVLRPCMPNAWVAFMFHQGLKVVIVNNTKVPFHVPQNLNDNLSSELQI